MKPISTTIAQAILSLCLVSSAYSQIQLSSLNSRAVKEGFNVSTTVDSLVIKSNIDHGLATTYISMVLTPSNVSDKQIIRWDYINGKSVPVYGESKPVDSIEISSWFNLPQDFVADSLWLWVDGKPQIAYIQDRVLAAQQYNQIVGTRRDPAILEFYGNGSYFLRVFPASSNKSRKVALQFHHTFNDDTLHGTVPHITAMVPVSLDSTYYNYYYQTTRPVIKNMQVQFSTTDNHSYSVDYPGFGTGTFSRSKQFVLSKNSIFNLNPGIISTTDPSGSSEFLWVGFNTKLNKVTAGVNVKISDSTINFEPEPINRTIILDIRNLTWDWDKYYSQRNLYMGYDSYVYDSYKPTDVWMRAQKMAVLALQSYCTTGKTFNFIISGSTVQSVFGAPVPATAENITKAISAMMNYKPNGRVSTTESVRSAINQTPKGAVILISDMYQPYNYYADNNYYNLSSDGTRFKSELDTLKKIVESSQSVFFTISDSWELSEIASSTGGYQLANLLNYYYYTPYRYDYVNNKQVQVLELPELFGKSNYTGLANVKVESADFDSLVYTNSNVYRYRVGLIMEDAIYCKGCGYYRPNSFDFMIAGILKDERIRNPISASYTISGRFNGLKFTKTITAKTDYTLALSSTRAQADVQWAFRLSEALGNKDWSAYNKDIKSIGLQYHIVTRQTSLLALEPGMTLWVDSNTTSNPNNTESRSVLTADSKVSAPSATNGVSIDSISLEALIANNGVPVVKAVTRNSTSLFAVKHLGSSLHINLGKELTGPLTLSIIDLKGSKVASVSVNSFKGSAYVWQIGSNHKLSRGFYTLHITGAGYEKKVTLPLFTK